VVAAIALEETSSERRATPSDTEEPAALLAVVADPVRLAVLQTLTGGTTCVCELQTRLPIAANLLSYHLKVLRDTGLVSAARRGRWVDYSLVDGALDRLHAALPGPPCGAAQP
jgi:ArsR family transcriptional regulator